MITEPNRVFTLAALVVTTGVAGVAVGRDTAQAEPVSSMTRGAAYAAARVDTAFDLVAMLPSSPTVIIPMAMKGDLPVPHSCLGVQGDAQAECMDVAYELPDEPSIVVETREGTTTTLMRMDAMTVAGAVNELQLHSE